MIGDDDGISAVSLGFGDVALSLPGHGAVSVVRVSEDDAGVVVGYVPTGAIGVFKADDGDLIVLAACGNGLHDVGREDVFALGVNAVGAVIVEVGGDGGNAPAFQIGANILHGIPGVVKLVVAQNGYIIADFRQGKGHGVGVRGQTCSLLGELIGGYGRALVGVSVVDQNDIGFFAADLGDDGGHIEHGIAHAAAGEQVGVPAASVHIGGGENGEFAQLRSRSAHGQNAQKQGQHTKQCEAALEDMFHDVASF